MWDTFACATANLLDHFIISIAVLENVPPDAGVQKRATFSTLNIGSSGRDRESNRANCVASSGTNRSAILYTSLMPVFPAIICSLISVIPPSFLVGDSCKVNVFLLCKHETKEMDVFVEVVEPSGGANSENKINC
jgi:hypothetical protein